MGKVRALIPWILLVVGLGIMLYPTVSSWWNAYHQSQVIQGYDEACHEAKQLELDDLWDRAQAYNQSLWEQRVGPSLPEALAAEYDGQLAVDATGVMGYVDIPTIGVHLPIYHGTQPSALQAGAGHLAWSSLPVGGESTHCVISAHTGMPTAAMFTDVRKLVVGDCFTLCVLDRVLTYEVDQILVVSPHDVGPLALKEGQDLCTLLTCTPYGVNTDRLLVRGHRVPDESAYREPEEDAGSIYALAVLIAGLTALAVALGCDANIDGLVGKRASLTIQGAIDVQNEQDNGRNP